MPANVETMFYVREKPWHGLGTEVQEAPTSADALIYAGLDWEVIQKNVYTENGSLISGYKVNLRSTDNAALGIVSDRYKVVQNEDAFQFTDDLLSAGVTPIRVVCQNTLNLALDSAKRIWTTKHTENVMLRVHEAEETLGLAEKYMGELGRGIDALSRIRLTDKTIKHLDSLLALTVHNGAFANFNVVNQFVDGIPVQFRQIQVFSDDCHPIIS